MGLFSFLFGKSDDPPAEPVDTIVTGAPPSNGPLPWPEQLALAEGEADFEWEWGNAHAHRLVHGLLEEARPRFGDGDRPARVKEVPDDEHIDLRGTYGGAPIRFAVWMAFGSFWTIEMRMDERPDELELERDLEKIPKAGDPSDPFAEDEGLRIFLARGIYVEGREDGVAAKLALWRRLPEAARAAVLAGLERVGARRLTASGQAIHLNQEPGLDELDDPIAYMEACAKLLLALREGLAATPAQPGEATTGSLPAVVRVACAYCGSLFMQTPAAQNCPNCGAAPAA